MEKIKSFTVDHLKLLPGLYVSRVDVMDHFTFTTVDIRVTRPNFEPVMDTSICHTIEHLGATYLRSFYPNETMYFGPMGCRTGFYLLWKGDVQVCQIYPVIVSMFEWIRDYEGEIPGASPIECGNYLDLNLNMAKYYANKYLTVLYEHKYKETDY